MAVYARWICSPDSIRKPLLEMLREKRLTQVQIREEINRLIREAGLPEEQQLSPAAISREASRNELIARNLRDLREQTKAMMAELGDKPTGETTALILEMSRAPDVPPPACCHRIPEQRQRRGYAPHQGHPPVGTACGKRRRAQH